MASDLQPPPHKLRRREGRPRRRTPVGASPGTLVRDPAALKPIVSLIAYGPERLEEKKITNVAALRDYVGRWPVVWVNVDGLGDLELVHALGAMFGLHRLALEDVVNTHQRPKAEDYDDHIFIATRMVAAGGPLATEQFTLFLGRDYVLTFQERPGDCFDAVRQRLRLDRGHIREQKPDYLAYALLDAIIDGFFPVLEKYGERLEGLEDRVMAEPSAQQVPEIHALKRDLLNLRRAIWPQREMISGLTRGDSDHVGEQTRLYLRDCYDHTIQLMDLLETYREVATGLVDVYLSSQSARMNEIMKMLTIIATIFIPLGFIASLYGMNFDSARSPWNMPELEWRYGYFYALGVMSAVAGGLLYYFRRKGWIGGAPRRRTAPPSGPGETPS